MYKDISFFGGLNALRFFAAFLVVMHHAETIKKKYGLLSFSHWGLFRNGENAVAFFFVLSGFLITYLLLKEQHQTHTISIRNFYIKRILRIWPLYFLLVFIGAIVLPILFEWLHINYEMPYSWEETWYYFVFFMPCLVTFFFGHHFLEPLWSIGVEEVFYLIWAPLFKYAKKKLIYILLGIIILKSLSSMLVGYYNNTIFSYLLHIFNFEAMAVGGIGAYLVFYAKPHAIAHWKLYSITWQWFLYGTLITFLLFHSNINHALWNSIFKTPIFSPLFLYFLFVYLIVGVSLVENNIFKLRNPILSYLGEISYGIYMYQMLLIFGIIQFLKPMLLALTPSGSFLVFYGILLVSSIVVSSLSKYIFENFFLGLKKFL